jgi:diaminohydroxyphosphoribosylaminopyrimidine deaminase / 5-amino-6-(5-phosphoribosylamino)uracil reductase
MSLSAAHLGDDSHFMRRAVQLARGAIGLASPNPQVGCVLVRDGEIFAEGAHLYDHRDHAEIVALKQAAERGQPTDGATAYVTLEPCSHHGRTGPCADALIRANVARCVVATVDPNPLVSGQGITRLLDAGIEVAVGICQHEARQLNDAFAHSIQHHRPFVTLKAALSVDGYLAPPPGRRLPNQPHWLTGPAARREVQLLRHASDAILTGIGTVLADDPALTDRSGLPRRRPLLRVVLDSQLRTPGAAQIVRSAQTTGEGSDVLTLCGVTTPIAKITALEGWGVEVQPVPDLNGRLSLPAVLQVLAERQILSLLLECGSELNGALLAQNLVDRAILFYSETELGSGAIPFAQGIESPFLFQQTLHNTTHETIGDDACISGYLHDPWPSATEPDPR